MRFVSFHRDGADGAGTIVPGFIDDRTPGGPWVVDVTRPGNAPWAAALPADMLAWTEMGLAALAGRLAACEFPPPARMPLARARLAAPLPRPGKIVGAAFNYHDALRERDMAPPAAPVIFIKSGRTVIGPGEAVRLAPGVGNVTYEAELAVVIGRTALRIGPDEAFDCVAGYMTLNDVSASDMVRADKAFVRGKNQPTFCPCGPWIATPDEVPDPEALAVSLRLDGIVRQAGSTRDLVFGIAELIAYASTQMPLDPGDIIATGTPAGVAASHHPPAWLRPGSAMSAEVQGLGVLTNPVLTSDVS
ncbi:fumarylacetoacetate hydrolase family protein [Bordetella genomosp. 9]|uniref:2-keto-4-pentenoate hydratase n=1 Tax=Bordetella genomosp. 9 TaxID=1416803 RepID=A0A1W6YZV0_9BORD|nr:fumarylacetoacetate hydrolase family protein [Bordetella genomosp. 9]ARP86586.1 2-keto-4-pentenoate hydratase [Bordetella genomosp. 9]ARP90581.1 2-keto-4-pentenoate hydratase [Bordetella genomosp. 9]